MDKKNLAKTLLLAMALTASTTSVNAATQIEGFETSTLVAIAGCQVALANCGAQGQAPSSYPYNGNGSQNNGGYSQYESYTADDSNSPFSSPSRDLNNEGYDRQGGGSSSSPYSSSSNPYSSSSSSYGSSSTYDSRNQNNSNSPYTSNPHTGGGSYQRNNNNPALKNNADFYDSNR